eukprot:COSAG05_NODE_2410_length_3097_cov_1.279186_1_plen_627_part_10
MQPSVIQRTFGGTASYLTFRDADGSFQGEIAQGKKGAVMRSRNGDFAEWRRKCPDETEFEEGDVIGIDKRGLLTRRTVGLTQVGVISRVAMVEGSVPDPAEQDQFDMVAYTGHVPVKLIGSCNAGSYIVPSGREDGTAVSYDVGQFTPRPPIRLGRAIETIGVDGVCQSPASQLAPDSGKQFELTSLPGGARKKTDAENGSHGENGELWNLVQISVVNPVDSVQLSPWRGQCLYLALLVGAALIFAAVYDCLRVDGIDRSTIRSHENAHLTPQQPVTPETEPATADGSDDSGGIGQGEIDADNAPTWANAAGLWSLEFQLATWRAAAVARSVEKFRRQQQQQQDQPGLTPLQLGVLLAEAQEMPGVDAERYWTSVVLRELDVDIGAHVLEATFTDWWSSSIPLCPPITRAVGHWQPDHSAWLELAPQGSWPSLQGRCEGRGLMDTCAYTGCRHGDTLEQPFPQSPRLNSQNVGPFLAASEAVPYPRCQSAVGLGFFCEDENGKLTPKLSKRPIGFATVGQSPVPIGYIPTLGHAWPAEFHAQVPDKACAYQNQRYHVCVPFDSQEPSMVPQPQVAATGASSPVSSGGSHSDVAGPSVRTTRRHSVAITAAMLNRTCISTKLPCVYAG